MFKSGRMVTRMILVKEKGRWNALEDFSRKISQQKNEKTNLGK